ncbi:MAG: methylated-DNA--[protein]-cysteine S-methyltransferase [Anaeroplasmataceae bacterium]
MYKFLYQSKIGNLIIKSDGDYLTGIEFEDSNNPLLISLLINLEVVNDTIRYLNSYFNGKTLLEVPKIKLEGDEISKKIWNYLMTIPYGSSVTYDEIIKLLNVVTKDIDKALNDNPILIIIPSHRVINNKIEKLDKIKEVEKNK